MTASILVVDDEPAIQDILTWALSAEGYRVATAGNGEEALSRVRTSRSSTSSSPTS
jgi:CheY-like chemotaxis protein